MGNTMNTFVNFLFVLLILSIDNSVSDKSDECVTYKELDKILSSHHLLQSHEERIASMEKMLQVRSVTGRAINGEGVAFSVTLSADVSHIGLQQPIKYDNVQLNEGNGYNKYTGSFTAPTDGVYLFSYFLGHVHVGQVWLELMHNGVKVNAGVTDGFDNYEDEQGGNAAVVRLSAGDTVWVENWHQNNAVLAGIYGFTTFSGVMIY